MMTRNYEKDLYEKYFNQSYLFYKQGLTHNLEKDIEILNSTIEILITKQGNNWIGNSDSFFIKIDASIAAAEILKDELEEMLKQKKETLQV